MRRIILLCIFLILTTNNAFAVSWTGGKVTFWSNDKDLNSPKMISSPYIMNADGTGVTKLIDGLFQEGDKTFSVEGTLSLSPDCQNVAFVLRSLNNNFDSINSDIAVLNIDSRRMVNLTNGKVKFYKEPRWSPDGRKIAFARDKDIYTMNWDGTNITMICEGRHPDWSPDGRKIAFARDEDIYTMDADGGNVEMIATAPTEHVKLLRWSPDSKQILLTTHKNDACIYIMDSNGDNLTLIKESSWQACWSPDGKKIAFVIIDDEDDFFHGFHIWLMKPDGSDLERLTNNDRGEAEFDWRDPVFGVSPLLNAVKTMWGKIKIDK
ncbi:hypothetical protein GF312_10760 [Candidatus Poribacteria bacterium]|nr:hypothetical protein [Candidatus Poribacteria bacterium]